MSRLLALSLTVLALLPGAASAGGGTTLYRWVDAQGVVHYSDSPQAGAQPVTVEPAQTYKAPPIPQTSSSAASSARQGSSSGAPSAPASCSIVAPEADQTFPTPDAVAVSVAMNPALQAGDQVIVSVDGTTLEPSDTGQAQIVQPPRGSHTVTAVVHDASGNVICTTAPVTFNVLRPSLNSPQSPARGR